MMALIYGQVHHKYLLIIKDYISHTSQHFLIIYLNVSTTTSPGPWSEKLQGLQIPRFLQVSELWVWTIVPFSLLIEEV